MSASVPEPSFVRPPPPPSASDWPTVIDWPLVSIAKPPGRTTALSSPVRNVAAVAPGAALIVPPLNDAVAVLPAPLRIDVVSIRPPLSSSVPVPGAASSGLPGLAALAASTMPDVPVDTTADPETESVPVPLRPTTNAPDGSPSASVPPLIARAPVELAPLAR